MARVVDRSSTPLSEAPTAPGPGALHAAIVERIYGVYLPVTRNRKKADEAAHRVVELLMTFYAAAMEQG